MEKTEAKRKLRDDLTPEQREKAANQQHRIQERRGYPEAVRTVRCPRSPSDDRGERIAPTSGPPRCCTHQGGPDHQT
jgi:hypothetical protein